MNRSDRKPADTNGSSSDGATPDAMAGAGVRHARLNETLIRRVLESEAGSSVALRRAAAGGEGLPPHLVQLVEKIHKHPYKVIDEDIDAGLAECSEDELFEVIVSASVGAARQRLLAGLRAAGEAE